MSVTVKGREAAVAARGEGSPEAVGYNSESVRVSHIVISARPAPSKANFRGSCESPVTSEYLKTLLGPEMSEVDRVLRTSLDSDVALIRQVAEYIVGGGGKRLPPALRP